MEMEQKAYTSEHGTITYWVSRAASPAAPVLVLLHGLTADHTLFDPQVAAFKSRCTLVLWDAPAHGLSRPYAPFTYQNCVRELKRILDAEKIEKAWFAGQSMGGYVIQAFLRQYPAMVQGFAGIDTCPLDAQYYPKADLWWLRQMRWMCRLYPHKLLVDAMAWQVGVTAPTRANMRKALSVYTKAALCNLTADGYEDLLHELAASAPLPCPVLLIVGEKDTTGKVKAYCDAWHRATGYPLHLIPGAAHNANYDAPDAVNALLAAFIGLNTAK